MRTSIAILLFALFAFAVCKHQKNWAVLVAGSDGWWNYRHQSDIFHTYQILLKNGYERENIIVFAKDDIATHYSNPFPGKVFNHPDPNGPGVDVYEGVIIDYKGEDVTPANYLKVIKGDKKGMTGIGSGKVLESNKDDNVFMFFSDHGDDNIICFPSGVLTSQELIEALKYMHEKKMYNQLVYYLEACYSGSMFVNLPEDMNIYTTTAANPHESSYAYYCGDQAKVNGKYLESCLGDEYSCKWMEDTEAQEEPETYTLKEQFERVKGLTKGSHVTEYGDLAMGANESVIEFLFHKDEKRQIRRSAPIEGTRIDSRKVKLEYLKSKAQRTNSLADISAYEKEIMMVARSRKIFDLFKTELNVPEKRTSPDINFDCLKLSIELYRDLCGFDERDIEFLHLFTSACAINTSTLSIYTTLRDICKTM